MAAIVSTGFGLRSGQVLLLFNHDGIKQHWVRTSAPKWIFAVFNANEVVERVSRAIGLAHRGIPGFTNEPGRSMLLKIDPIYYLAIMPGFVLKTSAMAGMRPENALKALVLTANLVTNSTNRNFLINAQIIWGSSGDKVIQIKSSLIWSSFVDRALIMHGGEKHPLPVCDIRLSKQSKDTLDEFLVNKTPLGQSVFA